MARYHMDAIKANIAHQANRAEREVNAMRLALFEIAIAAPIKEPDSEDYHDTESANSVGMDHGVWSQAETARKCLDALGIPWRRACEGKHRG
jgi:hypothetical protein